MSKVICDICGTSFPDTAEQCPICGYTRDLSVLLSRDDLEAASDPKGASSASVRGSTDAPAKSRRTADKSARPASQKPAAAPASQSKGGKFSQSNVRKRNAASGADRSHRAPEPEEEYEEPQKKESNGFLVVLLLIVIVALLAVTAYIGVKYFLPMLNEQEAETTVIVTEPVETAEPTEPPVIPCTSIVLVSGGSVKLDQVGQNWLMNIIVLPIDTTDALVFSSSDESVATVNSEGKITAVAPGEAVITITCGEQSMECKVTCTAAAEETTQPEETEEAQQA